MSKTKDENQSLMPASGGSASEGMKPAAAGDVAILIATELSVSPVGTVAELFPVSQDLARPGGAATLYQPMLDAMPHPAWVADDVGDVQAVNTRFVALIDSTPSCVYGAGWLDCLHEDDKAPAAVQWRASVASGLSFLIRVRLRLIDGRYHWYWASAKRFVLADQRPAWLATFTDINEMVLAEETKDATQRRFEATLLHAPVGVAYTSIDGQFTFANTEFCRLVGHSESELKLLTWQSITHPEDLPADLELGQAVKEGTRPFYLMDKRFIRKDGQPLYIRLFGNFIRDSGGEPVEGLAVILDLSDLRRAEVQRQRANQRRDEFLAMLAHELRNPLAPIRNSAALLRRRPDSEEVTTRVAQIIERQTAHLACLLDSLLDVARIARGRFILERSHCDLCQIIDQLAIDNQEEAAGRGLILVKRRSDSDIMLNADPVRLSQALGNLLDNAFRFTASGSVILSCEKDEAAGEAVCRVVDTGSGMDAETLTMLFQPFAQTPQGLARTMGGLGVGLMIVKAIADLHGGRVNGSSEGPGKGSTFELRLPLLAPSQHR